MVRQTYNSKRRLRGSLAGLELETLARDARYRGSPKHKRNPSDFGLSPPSDPRDDASLCDEAGAFTKERAQGLLSDGMRRGLVSEVLRGRWPHMVWAVTDDGYPLEARLENQETGEYHGYPMPPADPFREKVLKAWERKK